MRRADDHPLPQVETRRVQWFERVMVPLFVAAVAVFVTSVVWSNVRPATFQPLDYSTQRVVFVDGDGNDVSVPRVPGSGLVPSVMVGDVVPVIGDVCNSHDEPVKVSGVVTWNRLTPRGLNVEAGRGSNEIEPGCRALGPFENRMPDAVVSDVVATGEPELWQISGQVVIDEPNGGEASWVTESFWIVP